MSRSPATFPLGTCGLLAFLATAGIGWNLSTPAALPIAEKGTEGPETRHANRPGRVPRSVAAEAAARRMGSIRAAANPEARMLATLALAESLGPADFAAWVDGGWFDLRGGPELMMFTKILMDRWEAEDPEGLIAWAEKNNNGAGTAVMERWAAKDPQRLLAWFQNHRNDLLEVGMLGRIAGHSPELALQRLREMAQAGMPENAMRNTGGLMLALAGKSPAALEAILESLPADLKFGAESALSRKRLEASFSEEIRNLWDRPDGWRIFASMNGSPEIIRKLMGELGNLPDEWRRMLVSNPYNFVRADSAREWLETDLEGAGFSAPEIEGIRGHALRNLAYRDPAGTIEQLGLMEIDPRVRKEILEAVFRNNHENLEKLAEQLPEEERQMAEALMGWRQESRSVRADAKTTPEELLGKIVALDPAHIGSGSHFPFLDKWDRGKIEALTNGFGALPEDQKTRAATFITANAEYSAAPPELQGAALRYLAAQPDATSGGKEKGFESLTAKVSNYVTNLAEKDPGAAASWVGSLPPGEARTWAQKNLLKNWAQYDPDAAAVWEKSLPATDRDALEKIKR